MDPVLSFLPLITLRLPNIKYNEARTFGVVQPMPLVPQAATTALDALPAPRGHRVHDDFKQIKVASKFSKAVDWGNEYIEFLCAWPNFLNRERSRTTRFLACISIAKTVVSRARFVRCTRCALNFL